MGRTVSYWKMIKIYEIALQKTNKQTNKQTNKIEKKPQKNKK